MDDLDKKILALLSTNARTTIKEIAAKVSLTSPAVSERVRRLERTGVIDGYTVRLNPSLTQGSVRAVISIYVPPPDRERFLQLVLEETAVEECLQVTGNQSHMLLARCKDIEALEALVSRLQKLGQTNTQIILSALKSK